MAETDQTNIAELLSRHESDILSDWIRAQMTDPRRSHLVDESELRQQSADFLGLLRAAAQNGARRRYHRPRVGRRAAHARGPVAIARAPRADAVADGHVRASR